MGAVLEIHGRIADSIITHSDAKLHRFPRGPSTYTRRKNMEGAFFGYKAKDSLVRALLLANRKASDHRHEHHVCLGQETQVPNLMIIFGTVPNMLFYADYVPLWT